MNKWFSLLLGCLCLAVFNGGAQVPTYSKATTVNPANLFCWGYPPTPTPSKRFQMLYPAGIFTPSPPSGNITKLYFMYGNAGNTSNNTYLNPVIRLGQTTNTVFVPSSSYYSTLTTVWSPVTYTIAPGATGNWFEISLTTPFPYNNAQTLIVDIYIDTVINPSAAGALATYADGGGTGYKLVGSTYSTSTGSPYTAVQCMGFDLVAAPCTSPPAAGNVASSVASPVCAGTSINLTLSGNTSGSGQNYQWQSSLTAVGGYTNMGTASSTSTLSISPVASRYYRAFVTCNGMADTTSPLLMTVNNLMAGTYTINAMAPASTTNFQSFTSVVSAMSCGVSGPVVFNVVAGSGPYNEQVVINPINGASTTNTITFNGNNNLLTWGGTANTMESTLRLYGADFITFDNLTVRTTGTYQGVAIELINDADNNTISNCHVQSDTVNTLTSGYAGIAVRGVSTTPYATSPNALCDSNTIINNIVDGGAYGIALTGNTNGAYIFKNKVINNTVTNFSFDGIVVGANNLAVIEGNNISCPTRSNLTGSGINVHFANTRTRINGNIIHNLRGSNLTSTSTQWGIRLYTSPSANPDSANIISNNLIYDFRGAGIAYGIENTRCNNLKIVHNTIVIDNTASSISVSPACGIIQTYASSGVQILNNIIHINNTGTGDKLGISMPSMAFTANYNDYLVTGVNGTPGIGRTGSGIYINLPAWQAATGQDAASVTINPLYQNPAAGNYKPNAITLDNLGTNVGIATDLPGATRSVTTPDMGAYEFFGSPCFNLPVITVSGITATAANLSWTAASGSVNYEYILDQNSGNPAGSGIATANTFYNLISLLPFTTYYMHVRNNCGTGYSGWATLPLTTLCATPSTTITLSGPATFCTPGAITLTAAIATNLTYQWKLNGVDIVGATNASYTTSSAGTYTVGISMGTCNVITPGTVVTVRPRPTATLIAAGPVSFCQGGSVVLNANTGTGFSYQWLLNGTLIAAATTVSYTATATGTYRVLVSNGTCADTSNPINVTATPYPSPVITAAGPTAFCDGRNVRLNAVVNPVFIYQWYRNGIIIPAAVSSFYDATTAGSYTVSIQNGACSSTSNAITVTIYPLPLAAAYATGNTVFCNTGSVFIQGNIGAGLSYQWLRNGVVIPTATGASYTANQAGLFSVIVSNGTCTDTSVAVAVVFNSHPAPVIVLNNGVLSTTQTFPTYQWYRNSVAIPFSNASTYTPTLNGTYVVVVTDTAGCPGTSNDITITKLGTGTVTKEGVVIYPNPATNLVYIKCAQPATVRISAADGRLLITQANCGSVDISSLSNGVYTISIILDTGQLLGIEKLIKLQ